MKYLKKYENQSSLWIVVTEDYIDKDCGHQELFTDEESAQNNYLEIVNNYRSYQERNTKNVNLIITIEEAVEYVESVLSDICSIYFYPINIQDKHELREDIKLAREAKRYNI
jgi:hypothetical protein